METCLALLDEVGVKVVSQDAFPRQLEPHLWELLLELLVEVVELIVPVREGRGEVERYEGEERGEGEGSGVRERRGEERRGKGGGGGGGEKRGCEGRGERRGN